MNYYLVVHLLLVFALYLFSSVNRGPAGRYKWVGNPLALVFWVYILSAISSLFVPQEMLRGFDFSRYEWEHYAAYSAFVCLVLLPAVGLRGRQFSLRDFELLFNVRRFYAVASVGIWFSFFYQIPFALAAFSLGADEVRHGMNVLKEGVLPPTIWTTLAVVFSSFYVLFVFMFFYAVASRMKLYYIVSSFVGGALYVVSSICFTARDGPLFYVMTILFAFSMFRKDLSSGVRRRIGSAVAIVGGLFLALLVVFTAQRFFADGDSDELLGGTVGYIGQQPYVFAETIVSQRDFYGLDLRFPVFSLMLTGVEAEVVRTETYEWSFGTFLKDYYAISGWFSLVALSFFQTAVFYSIFRARQHVRSLFLILAVGFYFQLMTSGVFYFRLGTRGGNLYMLLYFAVMVGALFYSKRFRRS